jgi:phosphoribosylformimino-5-aminoimidazole carboxamide ribotide isomerase
MILYPSVHIRDGNVARLTREAEDFEYAESLGINPTDRARELESQGFNWLHVVDLNAAFDGTAVNASVIENIIKVAKVPIQLSGGMRDRHIIDRWLTHGIQRVVLTSAAVHNPELTHEVCRAYPDRVVVKIDSRDSIVMTTGWTKNAAMKALDLALRVEDAGAAGIIYAAINRDGALSEINVEAIADFAFALHTPVIASGGISGLHDIADLIKQSSAGISGLILGGALYNGKIDAHEALRLINR